jgi:hypothetical protein
MGQERRPLPQQMAAAPQQVAGGPPLGRLDRGLGAQATAKQRRHRVGIALLVCGCAAVHGFPIAGLPQDKGHALVGPEVGEPSPR